MIERLEGTFWGYQDAELFYQVWRPTESNGTIVITHGIAEHSECYAKLADDLAKRNWTVIGWDLRGHGKSEGKRGYASRFEDYTNDLDAAIKFIKSDFHQRDKKLILFGHSLGGLITLKTLINLSPSGISALALSSPCLGLTLSIPALKIKAAHWLAEWAPKLTLYNEIHYDQLTRDPQLVRDYKNDPLRHDKISPRVFLGMLDAMEEVQKHAAQVHLPTIMQLAGREKVVSTPESEKFFGNIGSKKKELFIYADSLHEIFNDLDRGDCINDLVSYLEKV